MTNRFGRNTSNYGQGVVELDAPEDELDRAEQATERLRAVFNSPAFAPPVLPAAAMDVHRMSQARDVKFEQLLATLEKDPMLAARVLKVASSPVYGGAPLQSLHSAVTRLGLKNLGAIVWEVALNMKVFRSKAYAGPMDQIRRHSTAVAHVARTLAKQTAIPLEYAFLCGLLHDVGAAATLLVLGENSGPSDAPLAPTVLEMVLAQIHADASQLVAKCWNLPGDLQWVLGGHHSVLISGYPHPVSSLIAVTENLVAELGSGFGLGSPPWDNTTDMALLAAKKALGLEQRAIDSLHNEIIQTLQTLEH
jgi:HD-like signal output (HDOD) protein